MFSTQCFAFSMFLCNLKSSWFPSFDVLSLLVCQRIYGYHPQHGTLFWITLTLHGAHAVATRCNAWQHGPVKYKAKSISKLAMMRLKRCGFSSCHKSDMISPLVSNFEFQKMWDQRAKRSFWRYPSFSNGFLRVFYGLGKHVFFFETRCFQNPLRVFYGLLRVFYGVPEIQQLVAIFSHKDRTISQYQCGTVKKKTIQIIHGSFVYSNSLAGRLGFVSKSHQLKKKRIHSVMFSGNLPHPHQTKALELFHQSRIRLVERCVPSIGQWRHARAIQPRVNHQIVTKLSNYSLKT